MLVNESDLKYRPVLRCDFVAVTQNKTRDIVSQARSVSRLTFDISCDLNEVQIQFTHFYSCKNSSCDVLFNKKSVVEHHSVHSLTFCSRV